MAVWGTCPVCDKLVPIRRHGWRLSNVPRWVPLEHDADGKRCSGAGKDVG